MSGFSADWLSLREPFDAVARSGALVEPIAAALAGTELIEIVDLACGTGANVRYLAPRLGGRQRWTVVDHDPQLLAELGSRLEVWAAQAGLRFRPGHGHLTVTGDRFEAEVRPVERDLAHDVAQLVHTGVHLVTAAALLDLVSEPWLTGLVAACRSARAAVIFALTYDGVLAWSPADPDDAKVRDAFNRHQRSDKGFGAALGPAAAGRAATRLRAAGFDLAEDYSHWHIGPAERAMHEALLAGCRAAAVEIDPDGERVFTEWSARRAAVIAQGGSTVRVGHVDLAGRPR